MFENTEAKEGRNLNNRGRSHEMAHRLVKLHASVRCVHRKQKRMTQRTIGTAAVPRLVRRAANQVTRLALRRSRFRTTAVCCVASRTRQLAYLSAKQDGRTLTQAPSRGSGALQSLAFAKSILFTFAQMSMRLDLCDILSILDYLFIYGGPRKSSFILGELGSEVVRYVVTATSAASRWRRRLVLVVFTSNFGARAAAPPSRVPRPPSAH
ncbi:hypothetical protein EVAR_76287_1 [Eumeta japonica]|uniref:Uncharacterized protein n=1 Tax=Eumeta variegata TaxID=151549 RepID=A0A4C1UQE0_EUMVA|nr:hypothetical protein EVAR_76287_1 [Eumeta japonica]